MKQEKGGGVEGVHVSCDRLWNNKKKIAQNNDQKMAMYTHLTMTMSKNLTTNTKRKTDISNISTSLLYNSNKTILKG